MYNFEKEDIIRLFKLGYSRRQIRIMKKLSWNTVDVVIQRYLNEIDEANQETPEKPKKPMSGTLAFYFFLFLGLLIGIPYLVAWWREKNSSREKEREPETRKENLFDPSRDVDSDDFL